MNSSDGVRAALQSLAGMYIYDYRPEETLRRRINERFQEANECFSELLLDSASPRRQHFSQELVSIAVILSVQDVSNHDRMSLPAVTCLTGVPMLR